MIDDAFSLTLDVIFNTNNPLAPPPIQIPNPSNNSNVNIRFND
jgi:hypothetical protein